MSNAEAQQTVSALSCQSGYNNTVNRIWMGTMGWAYDDWRDVFYTRDVKQDRMLEQYGRLFDSIEIDSTFYGAPRKSTLTGWAAQVPNDFSFSAKLPRAISHERRLVGAAEAAVEFASLMRQGLGDKLGALLLQLPPEFAEPDREVLETFFQDVTSTRHSEEPFPWVVEFRHASWENTDIVDALAAQGVLTATTERLDLGGPLRYLRLLGTDNSTARFDEKQFDHREELEGWAKRLQEATDTVRVYVRNFYEGHAPTTLNTLRSLLGLPTVVPPGQQQMSLF